MDDDELRRKVKALEVTVSALVRLTSEQPKALQKVMAELADLSGRLAALERPATRH